MGLGPAATLAGAPDWDARRRILLRDPRADRRPSMGAILGPPAARSNGGGSRSNAGSRRTSFDMLTLWRWRTKVSRWS